MGDYKLSASLTGHEDDVRAVSFASPSAVLSASRDGTVRHWKLTQPSPPTYDPNVAFTGSSFINALTHVAPSTSFPDGLIFSGGKDTIIDVRPPGRPPESDAERLLLGHAGNVCALDADPNYEKTSLLVSGSWDASALVWDVEKGEPRATLGEHEGSVWAVLVLDSKIVITGCADKLIRVWSTDGKLMRTIRGSTDVVRALCRLPPGGPAAFASAGNDATVRLWTLDGQEVAQLHGHENFIYSLACLPNGDLVSSSEDRTVRIWRNTECIQTITHPAISVWSVAACAENGDIVTGASDRVVRVFSRDKQRHADEETLKAFNDAVQGSAIPQQQMPEINKEKLPGPEFLKQKSGTKEGQVQMIREDNGNVTAHQWSAADREWINVGTVVDSQGSSGKKQEYLGQDYDYVFDVDIAEGQPPLKLPFNLSQNPYEVAQKFIAENELPITYLDQVANFILTNTQGAAIGQDSQQPQGADPWGSENRYRPDGQPSPAPQQPRPQTIPQKEYLYITSASYAQMFKKIVELNTRLASSEHRKLAFAASDLQLLPDLTTELNRALENATPEVSTTHTLKAGVDLATHIITTWPPSDRIPGLDLYRLLTAATGDICSPSRDFLATLRASGALPTFPSAADVERSTATANTTMLTLRSIANLFAHMPGRELLSSNFDGIWSLVSPFLQPPSADASPAVDPKIKDNRNVHIATTTIAINYSIMFILSAIHLPNPEDTQTSSAASDTLTNLQEISAQAKRVFSDLLGFVGVEKVVDGETVYRALVAVGTLMFEGRLGVLEGEGVKGKVREMLKKVERGSKEPRIRGAVGEVRALLD